MMYLKCRVSAVTLRHVHGATMWRHGPNERRRGDSQSMNDTWNVAQYCEKDVDQEIGIAATFEEDAKRWQDHGEDDFANVAVIDQSSACVFMIRKHDGEGSCMMLCVL